MKIKKEQRNIDIIYPYTLKEAIPSSLMLCEGFISRLIKEKADFIKIKINTKLKLVECNNKEVKSYLDIVLKSNKISEFYNQFISLLHEHTHDDVKKAFLLCREDGTDAKFELAEIKSLPDFTWEIKRLDN